MGKVIIPFCWHQHFVPLGLFALPRGYIHVLNHEKSGIKSDFKDILLKLATTKRSDKTFLLTSKLCSLGAVWNHDFFYFYFFFIKSDFKVICLKLNRIDKMFLLTSKFHPQWVVSPCPRLYTCIKSWKMCIKSDVYEIFFKLVGNDRSDKKFLLTSKFCPLGLSAPDLRLYTFIKSWKDVYKFRGWRDLFETCNKWPKWWGLPVDIKCWSQWVVCPKMSPRVVSSCPGAK